MSAEELEEAESSSQPSDVDTDWSDSDSEREAHVHTKGEFFGCYLLVSRHPKFRGRTYIGFTVDPNRRLKQHNLGSHKGGARKTSGKGPWDMVLIVHGFPSHIAALRFEWAWQNPSRSRRLGKSLARKKKTENHLQYRFRILAEMLSVGPWWRLPLTIRWLKQEFQLDFPVNKQPPLHMPIAYGLVDLTTRRAKSDHAPPLVLSQPTTSGNSNESSLAKKCQFCADGCDDDEILMSCYHRNCTLSAHVTCLAPRLSSGADSAPCHLIPTSGVCPKCGHELLWGELVRKYKASSSSSSSSSSSKKAGQDGHASQVPVPTKKRKKLRLSSSQPETAARAEKKASGSRVAVWGKCTGSHWSEALHIQ